MISTTTDAPRDVHRRAPMVLSATVLSVIVLITAIAPVATDMYVPAFPLVGRELVASATQVQLTLTTFFVGMALGQLVGGPASDRIGRRVPLLVALAALAVASAVCAWSPTITVMMAARLVQGFSGGWAMVIARSIVVDLTRGAALVRAINVVAGASGVAPIVGPLIGAAILQLSHWRVSFWVVAAVAALMFVAVAVGVPETLPADNRHGGGLSHLAGTTRAVLRNRNYVGYLLVFSASMGMTFAYVATSAFVLQSMNGLSPLVYSITFAFNAVGLTVATIAAARLANRVSTRKVVGAGLAASAVAAVILLVGAMWFGMPLPVALVGFFILMSAQGLIGPNAGALASDAVPEHPGTGSALLGFLQWCMAGGIAPLAGLGGTETAVPMAAIVAVLAGTSAVALGVLTRPKRLPVTTVIKTVQS
ncbi:multidrug effflux MFS transporter [Mycobacteroides salmoniphilum]|uniref:Bicyclomycin resistance protein n=1 Tax=Mycobacteroides salmoniphilum TaxID=404941 RepID=A0A4R8SLT4_9MYCO|nr:multidrug effflux MFS transporter [Mycobacteroides salmoniphilum]TDZ98504.1 Bicyclomycin resistance protein [Mycobacteroides salmoniphilum]TEA03034.1 Bicyclomycin resistance protein [Mycobacteroides salmoniphilum]